MARMVDRDAGLDQDLAKKLKRLFAADARGCDRFADERFQFGRGLGKPELRIGVGNTADRELDDVEGHLDEVNINVVHILKTSNAGR